jgi:hypothetical protein
MRFAPKWEGAFKAPFTAAEGWGTYQASTDRNEHQLELKYGSLHLNSLRLGQVKAKTATARVAGKPVKVRVVPEPDGVQLSFPGGLRIAENESLVVVLG